MKPTKDPSQLSRARQIDELCDDFEARWSSGERPRIEDLVAPLPEWMRDDLLKALLAVELELRAKRGDKPTEAEYRSRFPAQSAIVSELFTKRAGAGETSVSRESHRTETAKRKPAPAAEPMPAQISRYQIQQVLGEGAFGAVYKARDPQLERDVAIKVPKVTALGSDFDAERFLKEAKAVATIRHSNICPVYDAGIEKGRPYIVMGFVAGQTLGDFIKGRKSLLPAKQVALLVRRLALALQAAHEKGIVHRDLKPGNIMIDRERNDVVITDFGLARVAAKNEDEQTRSGVIMGTPAYMAPEQARGDTRAVGPRSDIYALGVILYELLTGHRPFAGSVGEVIGKVLHIEPEPPSKVRKGVDPALESVCRKAMMKDLTQRYASMRELAEALGECLREPGAPPSSAAAPPSATTVNTESRNFQQMMQDFAAEQRAGTEAAIAEAVAKVRVPLWKWLAGAGFLGIILLGGILFFAKTPTTTVIVKVDGVDPKDPTLDFFMDGKQVAAAELENPVELKVGKHELLIKRKATGERLRVITFLVAKDSRTIEIVDDSNPVPKEKERPQQKENPSPKSVDPDRAAAEWVISVGGWVRVAKPDRVPATWEEYAVLPMLYKVGELPKTPFKLVGLEGLGIHGTDAELARFAQLTSLRLAWLQGCPLTDKGLALLAKNPEFISLDLRRTQVTDDGLSVLHEMKKLRSVYLTGTQVTNAGLLALRRALPSCSIVPEPKEDPKPKVPEVGFVPIFNGKDLAGWEADRGLDSFSVDADGNLLAAGDTPAGFRWLMTTKEYSDFVLRFEFSFVKGGATLTNSGVTLRAVKGLTGVNGSKLEVQIRSAPIKPVTGAVIYTADDAVEPTEVPATKPPGDWSTMEIEAVGPRLKVTVNGKLVNDVDLSKIDRSKFNLKEKGGSEADLDRKLGRIGLQSFRGPVKFRNIRIKELTKPATAAPADAVAFQGKRYKFYPQQLSWKDAKKRCEELGGHLAIITNKEQNAFCAKLITDAGRKEGWLGATDEVKEGTWVCVDGSPMTFNNWEKTQPNNKGGVEHYLILVTQLQNQWSDQPNVSVQHQPGFICQWD